MMFAQTPVPVVVGLSVKRRDEMGLSHNTDLHTSVRLNHTGVETFCGRWAKRNG